MERYMIVIYEVGVLRAGIGAACPQRRVVVGGWVLGLNRLALSDVVIEGCCIMFTNVWNGSLR